MSQSKLIALILGLLFCVYAAARATAAFPAVYRPHPMGDTRYYLRLSEKPVFSRDFLMAGRTFVFPLLLKAVSQNEKAASMWQLIISIVAWGFLASHIAISFKSPFLQAFSFLTILALSLVRYVASWDFTLLTESLSISWFVIFIAVGIWLLRGWMWKKVVALALVGAMFVFTRDTNAYLALMWAGMIFIVVLFRWLPRRALVVSAILLPLFILSYLSAETGERWEFPLVNVIGRRILPNPEAVEYFQACGMPVDVELLDMSGEYANGRDSAFLKDPKFDGFRVWLNENGKSCYVKWLVTHPSYSVVGLFAEFNNVIAFPDSQRHFSRRYEDLLPSRIERLLYPAHYVQWIWAFLTLAALFAIVRKLWQKNPLWSAFIFLCLPIFPHFFISWHGDAMAPNRHVLLVGIQLALSVWLLIFLVADLLLSRNHLAKQ